MGDSAGTVAGSATTSRVAATGSVGTTARGTTTIADQVVTRIAAYAARLVPEVAAARPSSSWESLTQRLPGRATTEPRASATVAGDRAIVELEVASLWPASLADVAREVQTTVADRVRQLTGLAVDRVDVRVSNVVVPDQHRRAVR